MASERTTQEPPRLGDFREGKRQYYIAPKKGQTMGLCASLSHKYICCSTHVLRSVSNCPFECSYCFLQNYLTNSTLSVIGDTPAMVAEIKEKIALEPWRFFRIGTWELGDSLALEPHVPSVKPLIEAFTELPNALLELKTKSNYVENLLKIDPRGRVVVSWSLNPDKIIVQEEPKTARLEKRLEAMKKVVDAGYWVGLHFDPMIVVLGWEEQYADLVQRVFENVPPERVVWISVGSLRFNPEMKKKMDSNYPNNRLTCAEMVVGDDNKLRYVKPLRIRMYRHLYEAIRRWGGDQVFVYLCMERPDMWNRIFGQAPRSVGHLDYLITQSLYRRFSGLVAEAPKLELYDRD